MSFLKVAGLRFIVFSILFTSIFIGCSNSVSIKKLVFNKCKVLLDGKLYSGEYQKNNLNNNLIIGIVKNGLLIETREYVSDRKLARLRIFSSCEKGVEKIYSADGKLYCEGEFNNYKRVGLWRYYSRDSVYEIKY
jgi:antitoxin component YwqK of YwqJK toxin-antitoxin module